MILLSQESGWGVSRLPGGPGWGMLLGFVSVATVVLLQVQVSSVGSTLGGSSFITGLVPYSIMLVYLAVFLFVSQIG